MQGDPDLERVLVATTILAGGGDYLEIGFYEGWSANVVFETKRRYGIKGKVVCIDPKPKPTYLVPQGMTVVVGKSPDDIPEGRYSLALVDGDHFDNSPLLDWEAIHPMVTGYVVFHDLDILDVLRACDVARHTPGWTEFWKSEHCFVVKRMMA